MLLFFEISLQLMIGKKRYQKINLSKYPNYICIRLLRILTKNNLHLRMVRNMIISKIMTDTDSIYEM